METPILFLIFNRPDLTAEVFARIKQARPKKLFVAADGPRPHKTGEQKLCEEANAVVLNNINWDCEVHTLIREDNLGCKIAVSSAITWFFNNVEEGIILEDDVLPDLSFFRFCEEMLEKYRNDKRITQISGVNLFGKSEEIHSSYFFSKIGGIWGWATWRRVWQHYHLDIANWKNESTKRNIKQFLNNKEWYEKIEENFNKAYGNQVDTWDYQWVFTQFVLNGMTVTPALNLIQNVGFRDDATHTKSKNDLIETKLKAQSLEFPLLSPAIVTSNQEYISHYFSLLPKPQKIGIKRRVKDVFKKFR